MKLLTQIALGAAALTAVSAVVVPAVIQQRVHKKLADEARQEVFAGGVDFAIGSLVSGKSIMSQKDRNQALLDGFASGEFQKKIVNRRYDHWFGRTTATLEMVPAYRVRNAGYTGLDDAKSCVVVKVENFVSAGLAPVACGQQLPTRAPSTTSSNTQNKPARAPL